MNIEDFQTKRCVDCGYVFTTELASEECLCAQEVATIDAMRRRYNRDPKYRKMLDKQLAEDIELIHQQEKIMNLPNKAGRVEFTRYKPLRVLPQ